jgi:hypothetical protein
MRCWPLAAPRTVSSGWGWRWGALHDGLDFACPEGTPVYSCHDGTVHTRAWDEGGYGWWVEVVGDDGTTTHYGHLSDNEQVPTGSWQPAGTRIGLSGNTGGSTGPHLHLRVKDTGQAQGYDPEPWLAGAAEPGAPQPHQPATDEARVVRWLLDNTGWSPAGVAGVAGNIQQESSFNPTITEGGRPFDQLDHYRAGATAAGFGLCQWSFDDEEINGETVYGRLFGVRGLLAWCAANGLDHATIDGQGRFILHEVADYWPDLGDRLAAATDPWAAAQDFGAVFEGFGVAGARNEYAQAIHPRILAGEFGPVGPSNPVEKRATAIPASRKAVPAYT